MVLMMQMGALLDGRGFGGGGFGRGDGFGFFLPGLIGMVAMATLVGLVVWLVLRNRVSNSADPLRHAAGRYAAGKIGRVEFERISADLGAAETAPPRAGERPADPPASG